MSWPLVKLRDCCEVVGGATPKREVPEYWDSPDVPWVTPKDMSDLACPTLADAPEYISAAGFKSCSTSILPKGSVLVTSRAPIGNIAIAGRDLCTNQGFKSLIPGKSVDGLYLYYCMKHSSQRLQVLGNGATFKEVSKKIVEEFEIPLPPLPEQKRIAAILDKADTIRRKRQQAIQLADDFLRAVFLDMFGDPVTNPKGWEVRPLGQISNFENGDRSSAYPSGDDLVPEGVLFLSTKNIVADTLNLGSCQYITEEKYLALSRGKARKGDLIITLRGTLGSCCVFDCEHKKAFINAQMMIIRPGPGVGNIFLHDLLVSKAIKNHLQSIGQGAAVPQLTAKQLKELMLPTPPIQEQQRYEKIRDSVLASIKKMQSESEVGLFKAITQKTFRGEL